MKKINQKKKVLVAMSGGVDSSVAAKLLLDQGYDVIGFFLYFWKDSDNSCDTENKCCSPQALADARRVCDKIGIPLYTLDFKNEFKKEIVDDFLNEYGAGRTPNPCVRCNRFVKLGLLIEKARLLGFDYIASGHYARIIKNHIAKAVDVKKDQSYFLYSLTPEQIQKLIFPLGELTKDQVRGLAKKYDLPTASKSDSQEVCFIAKNDLSGFLNRNLKLKTGDILDEKNKVLGKHKGLPLYTIGQRKGVDIGGVGPFYVTKKDFQKNILHVSGKLDSEEIIKNSFFIKTDRELEIENPLSGGKKLKTIIRYGSEPINCDVLKTKKKNIYQINLEKPLRAITPGQSAVLYFNDEIIGGGVIE